MRKLLTILMLITVVNVGETAGQCPEGDTFARKVPAGHSLAFPCEMVVMNIDTYTRYYIIDHSYAMLQVEVPKMKAAVDSLSRAYEAMALQYEALDALHSNMVAAGSVEVNTLNDKLDRSRRTSRRLFTIGLPAAFILGWLAQDQLAGR